MTHSSLPSRTKRAARHGRLGLLILATLLLTPPPAGAARSPVRVDEVWSHADLGRRAIRSVAVLPAVTTDSYTPYHVLSDELAAVFQSDGRRWITPLSSWQGLGNSEAERLIFFRTIAGEVRNSGRTTAKTSQRLAATLGVDAVMLVRVDRWERVADASDVTTVEARAELVLADGSPMWRVSGRSLVSSAASRPRSEMPAPPAGNKLLETIIIGSGGGSSGGSGGSGGSPPVAGAAGASGSGSGGGGGNNPPPQVTRTPKIERRGLGVEDLVRVRDPGQPDDSKDSFRKATEQLVGAWAERRPQGFGVTAPAARDSVRR